MLGLGAKVDSSRARFDFIMCSKVVLLSRMLIKRDPAEVECFKSMLLGVSKNYRPRKKNLKLCGFMSMIGHLATGELMIVGRAVNGWGEKKDAWLVNQGKNEFDRHDIVMKTLRSVEIVENKEQCPMLWVCDHWDPLRKSKGYNTNRSQFWKVIRDVVDCLQLADTQYKDRESWPSLLVWTNLYKVSPYCGGNPNSTLQAIRLEHPGYSRT